MRRTHQSIQRCIALSCTLALTTASISASGVPKPLRSRFVIGDPVWRELPVRDDLQNKYDQCWQTAINTILENNFNVATMDKDSGYLLTTWNERAVALNGNWAYKVQVSLKMVYVPADPTASPPTGATIQKVRIQVAGELSDVDVRRGKIAAAFHGYDQVLLQNLLQDLEGKLGVR